MIEKAHGDGEGARRGRAEAGHRTYRCLKVKMQSQAYSPVQSIFKAFLYSATSERKTYWEIALASSATIVSVSTVRFPTSLSHRTP